MPNDAVASAPPSIHSTAHLDDPEGLAAHLGPPTTIGSTSSAGDFRASFFSLRLASLHAELQVIPESIVEAMAAPGGPVSDAAYLDRKVVDLLVPALRELWAALETP